MIRFLQTPGRLQKSLLVGFLAIICIMMVVTLVPGGIFGDKFNTNPNVVAKVGSREITIQEANRQAEQMIRQQFGGRGDVGQLKPFFVQRAVGMLVMQNVFLAEAERLGLKVTDDELRYNLEHGPLSQALFPEGKFIGTDGYRSFVQNQFNMPIAQFEELVKKDLLMQKLRLAVEGGVTVSDAELREAFKQANTKVKFDYAVISLADVEKTIKPSEAELKAYFEKNQAQFANAVPEQRKVRYFVADPTKMPNAPKVSDADLQSYYNAHQDEFRVPESVTARHILIKANPQDAKTVDAAKAKAEDVLKQVKAGGNFAALAKKYSDDPGSKDKGGELGVIRKGQTVPEFEQAAMTAKKGDVVGPVKTMFGFHIIQVSDKTEAHLRSLAEVRNEILPVIERQKAQAGMDALTRTLESESRNQGLEKTAAAHGLEVLNSPFVSREDSLPGVGNAPSLMDAIFGAKPMDKPITVTAPAGVVVAQVTEVKPAGPATFESVKDRIAEFLKRQGAQMELAKRTQELSEKARSEHNLRNAAKAVGATFKSSELVRPDQQVADLGQVSQIPNIMGMKPGEISGPVNAGQSGVVVQLVERQEPSDADFNLGKDSVKEQLLSQKKNEAVDVYASALRDRMEKSGKLRIFEDRMKQYSGNAGGGE
jgi:peptidyl-prolyl cis-trans isomerase D